MLIKYKNYKPQKKARFIIENANRIIEDYRKDGYRLTLRQLYYQFVQENLIPNNQAQYDSLGNVISRGRLAGMVSWHAIEDKHRSSNLSSETMDDLQTAIDNAKFFIHCNHWDEQKTYVEVWVEKDALGNVIERACDKYDIPHMACKGYLSTSEAWRAGQRFKHALDQEKECFVIHLGDHDASGIDMSRDNQDRLDMFTRSHDVVLKRIALNMSQVEHYTPPPNFQKQTDPRAKHYIKKFGDISWELDALKPRVIVDLINTTVEEIIDIEVWETVKEKENKLRCALDVALEGQNL